MADIYREADRVVVWLGPGMYDTKLVMDTLRDLVLKVEVDWSSYSMRSRSQDVSEFHWADRSEKPPYDDDARKALINLLSSPWFERLWVWQEVRLANQERALLMCGSEAMSWTHFSDAIYCLDSKPYLYSMGPCLNTSFQPVNNCRPGYNAWIQLVERTGRCKCFDDRDRVYALQSMLSPQDRKLAIAPDYKKSVTQVYTDLVLQFLQTRRKLDFLQMCEMKDEAEEDKEVPMPTWVPNLAVNKKTRSFLCKRAAGLSLCDAYPGSDGILNVSGLRSAIIKSIKNTGIEEDSKTPEIIEAIKSLAPENIFDDLYIDGGTLFNAFHHTMAASLFAETEMPPRGDLPSLKASGDALRTFLKAGITRPYRSQLDRYVTGVYNSSRERLLFATEEGYIGLGPKAARPGDHICVLLGSDTPLVLRRTGIGKYRVVGECFVYGLMNAEALLGRTLGDFDRILRFDEGSKGHDNAYINRKTQEIKVEDPRLGPLPPGWSRMKHDEDHLGTIFEHEIGERRYSNRDDPRFDKSHLENQGVQFEVFELI